MSTASVTVSIKNPDGSISTVSVVDAPVTIIAPPPPPPPPPPVPVPHPNPVPAPPPVPVDPRGFPSAISALIPANALITKDVHKLQSWKIMSDAATGNPAAGDTHGTTIYPFTTPKGDTVRQVKASYPGKWRGARASVAWLTKAADTDDTHMVYHVQMERPDPSQVINFELDHNHVLLNGDTVILATQFSGASNTVEVGTVSDPDTAAAGTLWKPSKATGFDPRKAFQPNVIYDIYIGVHRNAQENYWCDWVCVNNVLTRVDFSAGKAAQRLGWPAGLRQIQYQLDGANDGGGVMEDWIHGLDLIHW